MAVYLVTGVAGFIASQVAAQLLAQGHTVVGLDNVNDYYDVRLKEYRLKKLNEQAAPGRFIFRKADIEDLAPLEGVFKEFKFDAVFNLAARAGVQASLRDPYVYLRTNTQGTLNVLECQRKAGVKKMVLASTSSLYAGCPMPFTEEQPVNTPLSPYAATKKAAEMLAHSYYKMHGLDITVVRYFTVFGPAGRPDMSIFRFIQWMEQGAPIELFGDGSQSRDFTYVDDIARGTILAARPLGFEIVNLGGGRRPVTLQAIIAQLEKLLGRTARFTGQPFHPADIKETWADITKAAKLLGWKPAVSLEEGLQKTVDWHRVNQGWLRQIKL